jgi:hypothetical protein
VQLYQRVGVSIVVGLSESWSFHCFVGLSVTGRNMEVEKVLHMNAGLGNSSYAQNSNLLQVLDLKQMKALNSVLLSLW